MENYGNNTKYMFFLSELSPRFILSNDASKYLELKYQKKLEVYGDGKSVKSISIAPFIFETKLKNKSLSNWIKNIWKKLISRNFQLKMEDLLF